MKNKYKAFAKLCDLAADRSSNVSEFWHYMKPVFYGRGIDSVDLFKKADPHYEEWWTRWMVRCTYNKIISV